MQYYIITFPNTHNAMDCEQKLRTNEINIAVIPTPTSITKSCGIAIRFKTDDSDRIFEILNKENIVFLNIYKKQGSQYINLTDL